MKNIFKLCKSHWKKEIALNKLVFTLTLFLFQLLQLAKFLHASKNEAEIDGNVHQLIAEMALVVSKLLDCKNYFSCHLIQIHLYSLKFFISIENFT